jgi:hypothetical protein
MGNLCCCFDDSRQWSEYQAIADVEVLAVQSEHETEAKDASATRFMIELKIDEFIRTTKAFNSSNPCGGYVCRFSDIQRACFLTATNDSEVQDLLSSSSRFIVDVGGKLAGVRRLTPYQGTESTVGEFKCMCGRIWKSNGSWKDTWQRCKDCDTKTYPYKQTAGGSLSVDDPLMQVHDRGRCQRCAELGRLCVDVVLDYFIAIQT